jgi:hypothetical protein
MSAVHLKLERRLQEAAEEAILTNGTLKSYLLVVYACVQQA